MPVSLIAIVRRSRGYIHDVAGANIAAGIDE